MIKTLRISFSLKNAYTVNGILHAIKQMPILKKILPGTIYQVRGFKIFANVLSVLWEIFKAFFGKLLYFAVMFMAAGFLYELEAENEGVFFLHVLLCLSVIGSFMNTYMFNPTKDKYYALILLGMNAREYTLVNYFYAIGKLLVGFTLFGCLFGMMAGVPVGVCLLIPLFVAGLKLSVAAYDLRKYEKTGVATSENKLGTALWIFTFVLLAAAYGLPVLGIMIPQTASVVIMLLVIGLGLVSLYKILTFRQYREIYREILVEAMTLMNSVSQGDMVRAQSHKNISADISIESHCKGFEYLNELFIKRHQKILWKSAKRIAAIAFILFAAAVLVLYLKPDFQTEVNGMLMTMLPYSVFFMYMINRGTGFTGALFMNCDHSLLTYSFYKKPKFILKLFQIRLREIIKINLLPAAVIGAGLVLLLFVSGGTDNPLNYAVLFVSVTALSVFFSVHYLTLYYLLQPYNAGTEIKSGMYQFMMTATYFVCYMMLKFELPTLMFGAMTIVFCVLYCIVASILVYIFAPRTFKIRN